MARCDGYYRCRVNVTHDPRCSIIVEEERNQLVQDLVDAVRFLLPKHQAPKPDVAAVLERAYKFLHTE